MGINENIKKVFGSFGLDVRWKRNIGAIKQEWKESQESKRWEFLKNYNIGTVIDIGANIGQFAYFIHKKYPEARIYCFEPLSSCFKKLKEELSCIENAEAYQIALGEISEKHEINSSKFSASSSLLPMTDLHMKEWPQSGIQRKEIIKMERLDDVMRGKSMTPELLIKVDVQGYEANVLKGGLEIFSKASISIMEVSFFELYQGQPLFRDIHDLMVTNGYAFRGFVEQFRSKSDGRNLFADAIFEKQR